jgi:hypothetical protein
MVLETLRKRIALWNGATQIQYFEAYEAQGTRYLFVWHHFQISCTNSGRLIAAYILYKLSLAQARSTSLSPQVYNDDARNNILSKFTCSG